MTLILSLALALGAAQQPRQNPALIRQLDSNTKALTDVAQAVANVRAETDRFRTRAFNDPAGSVLESAVAFRSACDSVAAAATRARRQICRSCQRGRLQATLDNYRVYMPTLAELGRRCAARLRARVTASSSQASLHQTALEMSNMLVTGLRTYERKVADVRGAMSAPARRTAT